MLLLALLVAVSAANITVVTTDAQFQTILEASGAQLTVIEFSATWCEWCQKLKPYYEADSDTYSVATFLSVDVDDSPDLAAKYQVSGIPYLMYYNNMKKSDDTTGYDPVELETKIQKYIVQEGHQGPACSLTDKRVSAPRAEIMNITTEAELDAVLASHAGETVIDFMASWCEWCQNLEPYYQADAAKYTTVKFLAADVDACEAALKSKYSVSGIPQLNYFQGTKMVDVTIGFDPAELETKIQKYMGSLSNVCSL